MKKISRVTVTILAAITMIFFSNPSLAAERMSITTGPMGGAWYPIGGALAEILNNHSPYKVDTLVGSGIANIERLHKGEAEIGLGNSCSVVDAYYAKNPPFTDYPRDNVANLLTFTSTTMQVCVSKGSGVKTIPDLKGKPFCTGKKGWTTRIMFGDMLKAYGMSFDDLNEKLGALSYSTLNMKDGHIIGFEILAVVPHPAVYEMSVTMPINLVGLSEEALQKVLSYNAGYMRQVIPPNSFKGVDYPVLSFGTFGSYIIRKNLPNDVVYTMTKAIMENLDELRTVHSSLKDLKREFCSTNIGVPFHPGAEKYYREQGLIK
jgi:TRAP transporter TAXI family solute receptor